MIPTIPTPDELLDKGFSRGKKQAEFMRTQKYKASERKKN